jgi:hypothetical protein
LSGHQELTEMGLYALVSLAGHADESDVSED